MIFETSSAAGAAGGPAFCSPVARSLNREHRISAQCGGSRTHRHPKQNPHRPDEQATFSKPISYLGRSWAPRSRSTQWPRWSMVSGCRQVWTRMSRSYPVLSASTPLRPKHVVRSHDRKTLINTPILAAGSRHSRRMPAKKSCKLHPKLLMDSEVSKL